jgi:lauroyl/myristoyl acyltransferase
VAPELFYPAVAVVDVTPGELPLAIGARDDVAVRHDGEATTHTPGSSGPLALDSVFWRRLAQFGATRAPAWFVRWSPPVLGAAVAVAMPNVRRTISAQLARARGPAGRVRNAIDVVQTFASYASCLTEVLSTGSKNGGTPEAVVHRDPRVEAHLAAGGGVIFATAHTAGWETMGPLLARDHNVRVMVVMQPERDPAARELNDLAREAQGGVRIVHVGDDPLASLPLLRHLRDGGVVALQMDRVPPGMSARAVTLFGSPGAIPEGPLRLAQLAGVPIVPAFSLRTGHRRYAVYIGEPVTVPRRADDKVLDKAAQQIADAFGVFVRAHPTQWFPFHR